MLAEKDIATIYRNEEGVDELRAALDAQNAQVMTLLVLVGCQFFALGCWLAWRKFVGGIEDDAAVAADPVSTTKSRFQWPAAVRSDAQEVLPRFQEGTSKRAPTRVQYGGAKVDCFTPTASLQLGAEVKPKPKTEEPHRSEDSTPKKEVEIDAPPFTMRGEVANLVNEVSRAIDAHDYRAIMSVCKMEYFLSGTSACHADGSNAASISANTTLSPNSALAQHHIMQAWLQISVKGLQKSAAAFSDALERGEQTISALANIDDAMREQLMKGSELHRRKLKEIDPVIREAQKRLADNVSTLKQKLDPAVEKLALCDMKCVADSGETRPMQLMMVCPRDDIWAKGDCEGSC